MNDKKQKTFEGLYEKFARKCLQENLLPIAVLRFSENGVYPEVSYYEVTEDQKKEILSSLDKKK